jgi:hypothetical protein
MSRKEYQVKVLLNPSTGKDVVDYPIAEAQKDSNGKPIWDATMGDYRTTGQTLEFTLRVGQAAEFEDYVADILLDRCSFLIDKGNRPSKALKEIMPPQEEVAKEAGGLTCKFCGQTFKTGPNLGLHQGAKHLDKIQG